MVVLSRVAAHVVDQRWAARVVGPAYDSVSAAERLALAAANPDSFFNVIKSSLDFDAASGPPDDRVTQDRAAHGRAALARLLVGGRYRTPGPPAVFLYQLITIDHTQTAVVVDVPVAAFASGVVRAHERTRESQEAELTHQLGNLGVNASPVGLTYRADSLIAALIEEATTTTPELDFRSVDAVRHRVWRLDTDRAQGLLTAFERIDRLYIVDGHHRVAAAARLGQPYFMAGIVAHDALRVLPYHRLVDGPIEVAPDALAALGAEPLPHAQAPRRSGEAVVFASGRWYRVGLRLAGDGAGSLDVWAADEQLLAPLAGVVDARVDERLRFIPGDTGIERLAQLAAESDGLAVALHPPTMLQLFGEADAGRMMPPKSTWFEPKLRSGVFLAPR